MMLLRLSRDWWVSSDLIQEVRCDDRVVHVELKNGTSTTLGYGYAPEFLDTLHRLAWHQLWRKDG